jgi:hypothetical protein
MTDRPLTSKQMAAIAMAARSLLRQARCPECSKNGMQGGAGCNWCRERAAIMDGILAAPSDETSASPTVSDWGALGAAQAEIVALKNELTRVRQQQWRIAEAIFENDGIAGHHWAHRIRVTLAGGPDASPELNVTPPSVKTSCFGSSGESHAEKG